MKELTQKMMFYSVIYQKIIAEVMKRQQMIDPVIVEAMDVEPQPSTSTAHIHASDSEHESDNEGIRRESEGESEVLDDSAFIERNVRSRKRQLDDEREEGGPGSVQWESQGGVQVMKLV